jgi:hypothetical protein
MVLTRNNSTATRNREQQKAMKSLQYFHYGQLVHHGKPIGDERILSKTNGISDDFIQLALETAKIPAKPDTIGISWGILRTKRGQPMVLARAEKGDAEQIIYQFIELPTDVLRELAGNLKALLPYVSKALPIYEMLGDPLQAIDLGDVTQTTDEQVDSLLDLLSYAHNNTRYIQPLIEAVISSKPLVITNAPDSTEERIGFIQGLLTLLPSSTRFGVTFLLHNTPDSDFSAQIMFMDTVPTELPVIEYNWESGQISSKETQSEYSRFITSQMRLDPAMVIRETAKLTPTAGWRFNSGDTLEEALDYASHRAKLDQSISSGMPVEVFAIATVLAHDPTLDDEQRLMYSRHLINFSLALRDLSHVDAITTTMNTHKEFENEVYQYMFQALEDGQNTIIFETLVRWLHDPFSPQGPKWTQMLSRAALAELGSLIASQDIEAISDYLDDIQKLGTQSQSIVTRVIEQILPLASQSPELPPKLMFIAITLLGDEKLHKLMGTARFIQLLPDDIRRLLALYSQRDRKAPRHTLIRAVNSVDKSVQDTALIAFTKLAFTNQRIDLIDEQVLEQLVKILNKNKLALDRETIIHIANQVHDNLAFLPKPAPRLLLQLYLITESYQNLTQAMIIQSRDIYGAGNQIDYIQSIADTFAQTDLTVDEAKQAIAELEEQKVGNIALLAAILGVLEGTKWHSDLQYLAIRVMQELSTNLHALEMLPAKTTFALLQYQARQSDLHRLRVAARVIGSCAALDFGKAGMAVVNDAYRLLNSNERTRPIAIEVVRQYIRECDEKPAQHFIKIYSDRLSNEVAKKLQVSYEFSNIMARMDWISYLSSLQIAVNLLQSVVDAYYEKGRQPNLGDTRLLVANIKQEASLGNHKKLSQELRRLAHNIVILGQRNERRGSDSERYIESIVKGSSDPRSTLDVYRVAGGHLLAKQVYAFRTKNGDPRHPLGDLSNTELIDHISIASELLHQAANAQPTSRDMWTYSSLVDEIDSQTSGLLDDHSDELRQMGRNWQRLADLIAYIYKNSDTKVIEASNARGKRLDILEAQPENVLELFRFIYGHFGQ